MYQNIVVGTDGSETATKAVDHAFALTKLAGGRLHIVTAYRPLSDREVFDRQQGMPPDQAANIDTAAGARELMAELAKRAADSDVDAEVYALLGDPGNVLLDVAAEVGADLVVVGSKGMTGVRRLLGSVPNHVTHHATCSVMVVRTT